MWKAALLAASGFALLSSYSANASPLGAYRDKARPVIVFGAEGEGAFARQIAALNRASAGLRERDMVVIPVTGEGRGDLRRAYRVSGREFQVLLVGKDGHVAFRSREPVTAQELFQLVDQMPMRREEMRRR